MKLQLASHAGFCFGVRRAVERTLALSEGEGTLYTLGDLIHNRTVVDYLRGHGIVSVDRLEEIPRGASVVIRSHGVPPEAYAWLKQNDVRYHDLTCPFVARIHTRVHEARDRYDGIILSLIHI